MVNMQIITSRHYYEIVLSSGLFDNARIARKSIGGKDIILYCQQPDGAGYKAEFFNYQPRDGDWVLQNGMGRMREFRVKRRYVPGTLEHKAFEQLSGVEMEAAC